VTPAEVAAVEASLVTVRFLGRSTRAAPKLAARLAKVETHLRDEWSRTAAGVPFELWHNVHSVGGYRKAAGYHGRGLAIDIDVTPNPYIATRTGSTFGGEASGLDLRPERRAAVEVCDRVCGGPGLADLSARRRIDADTVESTAAVFDRFEVVNVALRHYFAPYFRADTGNIKRRPMKGWREASHGALLGAMRAELLPGVVEVPHQVLLDYEAVRIPMVAGSPARMPGETRNPARGLMNLRRPVVIALCDVGGLRWGMSDFGRGSSGDGMHFDTASKILA
jgi:hypothetical protein